MQQIFVNSATQKIYGDDTKFSVDLHKQYQGKRLVLNQFIMPNLFSNFNSGEQDFSYITGSGETGFIINQIHLQLSEFTPYFNSLNTLQLTLTQQFNHITLTGDQSWAPIISGLLGSGWQLLGFVPGIYTLQGSQTATNYYQLEQSPIIYVSFEGLTNAYNGEAVCSFQIPNLSSFGGLLTYEGPFLEQNQQVLFQETTTISKFNITLQDFNHNQIQTSLGNNTGVDMFMSLSYYLD